MGMNLPSQGEWYLQILKGLQMYPNEGFQNGDFHGKFPKSFIKNIFSNPNGWVLQKPKQDLF